MKVFLGIRCSVAGKYKGRHPPVPRHDPSQTELNRSGGKNRKRGVFMFCAKSYLSWREMYLFFTCHNTVKNLV